MPYVQGLAALPPVKEWLTATVESTPGPLATALNEVLTGEQCMYTGELLILMGKKYIL